MDINSINRIGGNIDTSNVKKNTGDSSSVDFRSFLAGAIDKAQSAAVNNGQIMSVDAPLSWSGNDFGTDAISNAKAFLQENFGIDTQTQTPSHNVSDEQLAWLGARHDLSGISSLQTHTAAEQNLLADLVALNVISSDEASGFSALKIKMLPSGTELDLSTAPMLTAVDSYASMDYFERAQATISQSNSWLDWANGMLGGSQSLNSDTRDYLGQLVNDSTSSIADKTNTLKVLQDLQSMV